MIVTIGEICSKSETATFIMAQKGNHKKTISIHQQAA